MTTVPSARPPPPDRARLESPAFQCAKCTVPPQRPVQWVADMCNAGAVVSGFLIGSGSRGGMRRGGEIEATGRFGCASGGRIRGFKINRRGRDGGGTGAGGRVGAGRRPEKPKGRSPRGTAAREEASARGLAHQPQLWPLFCSLSQFWRGSKYSMRGAASISRVPVSASRASGHGRLWPKASMAWSFSPASLLP